MTKIIKKTEIYRAIRWDGNNIKEIQEFTSPHKIHRKKDILFMYTMAGIRKAKKGHYIVKDELGRIFFRDKLKRL